LSSAYTVIVAEQPSPQRTTAVIGGGLAGLTAALTLAKNGELVHLFESSDRFGGKIAETVLDGITIPTGADAFLARRPEVSDLATELGLDRKLISPSAGAARIYRDGRLHPLPPNVLGIPATTDLAATGLISEGGAKRAQADLTSEDDRPSGDESVGSMVRRRLGDEVLEYLVDPLLGGINAGDSDRLSLNSGTPQLGELRMRHPSLITSAKLTLADRPSNPGPVFRSIDGGINRLIDAAVKRLTDSRNVTIDTGAEATLERGESSWRVSGHEAANVVIATPARAASALVRPFAPDASAELDQIEYSSVAMMLMVFPEGTLDIDNAVSGVLVPRVCGLDVTAISFASHKWPNMAGDGRQILRVSVGRRTDRRWQALRGTELSDLIRSDVSTILGQEIPTGPSKFAPWLHGLPQYDVGHAARVERVDAAISSMAGLSFVGAWRHGLGLPACVASGRSAVESAT
jgi:oxygen-dependent protoporphyrinogen oxidase